MNDKVRLGMTGLGSFSVVITNTIRRSRKVELVTCFHAARCAKPANMEE